MVAGCDEVGHAEYPPIGDEFGENERRAEEDEEKPPDRGASVHLSPPILSEQGLWGEHVGKSQYMERTVKDILDQTKAVQHLVVSHSSQPNVTQANTTSLSPCGLQLIFRYIVFYMFLF